MMIEIEDSKVEKMSDYAEKMLKYGGKLMQCIEEISESRGGMGQRYEDDDYDDGYDDMGQRGGGGYGNRGGGYGNRGGGGYGNRYGGDMGQRRGVPGTGRYSRYR